MLKKKKMLKKGANFGKVEKMVIENGEKSSKAARISREIAEKYLMIKEQKKNQEQQEQILQVHKNASVVALPVE